MPSRVSGNQDGDITTGGHKTLPYRNVWISRAFSYCRPALEVGKALEQAFHEGHVEAADGDRVDGNEGVRSVVGDEAVV